jgi:DNA-binding protein HU-beta
VNKSELVERVADRAGLGRTDAAGALEAALEAIERELAAGGEVSITGFGKFSVAQRGPRQARNPQTGEPIAVPAGRAARFSPGAKLKQALAG